jgi:hypothetical protein
MLCWLNAKLFAMTEFCLRLMMDAATGGFAICREFM